MAYNEFAYFYDEFNGEADYEALYAHIKKELEAHGIHDGILADLVPSDRKSQISGKGIPLKVLFLQVV